jgi:hypothetical protein
MELRAGVLEISSGKPASSSRQVTSRKVFQAAGFFGYWVMVLSAVTV